MIAAGGGAGRLLGRGGCLPKPLTSAFENNSAQKSCIVGHGGGRVQWAEERTAAGHIVMPRPD